MRLKRHYTMQVFESPAVNMEQLKTLILEMEHMRSTLAADVEAEEKRSGISDPGHPAYSPLALATRGRRARLELSIRFLREKLRDLEQRGEVGHAA